MRLTWLVTLSLLLLPARLSADDAPRPAKVTYDDHVLPLLRDKCFACHNQDKKSGGLRLHTYTNLMQGSSSGEVVKPGDPDGSPLYLTIAHKQEPYMPPKSPALPKESTEVIRLWIQGGALENTGSKAIIVNKPKYDISLSAVAKGKPEGPPPMPGKPLGLDPLVRTARANALTALASSPWAPLLAVGGQKQVLLYHSDTLDLLGVLPFPEGVPQVLKFSRNGSLLLAGGGRGGKSGRVVVWSVQTGERIFEVGEEVDSVLAADISADQTKIALGGPSKVVRVYSTRDGQLLHEIRKHTDWVYTLEFSPDGVLLASGDRNGGLFVWEAHTGREFFSLRGHTNAVTDLSWRADSNVVASCSEDGTVRLWEMENGSQVKSWGAHGGGTQGVKFARDGRLVSCGRDRTVKVWDGNGGLQRTFEALPDVALRAVFSHDGGRAVGGDWGGVTRVWNTADGKVLGELTSNPPTVAERLDGATKEVAARQADADRLAAVAAASQKAAQQAAAELAAAQKAVTDGSAAVKTATEAAAKARAGADAAAGAVTAAQAQAAARDVLAKAFAEAAAKVQAAADQAKADKELAAVASRAKEVAAQVANDLAAAQKGLATATAANKSAADQLTASQQALAAVTASTAAAPKQVEARTAALKGATDKAAADKAMADQAAAALLAARARLDRLKASSTVARQPAK